MSDPFAKLAAQLSKLFELEKADLDFGIHRIIKARQRHIRVFLGLDEPPAEDPGAPTLKKIVQREMGELNTVELERQLEATAEKIKTNYGQLAFESGRLADGPAKDSGDGQLWMTLKEELDSGEEKANAQLEAEIYSHLTEFFSRYYEEADFLSKRRIKAGDAPYAVPYSGEEVMLHWANKDQYYIKSSKDLKDYTFTLPEQFGGKRVQFKCERQDPVLNNNNAKREFHLDLDDDGKPQIEASEDADGKEALVIGFHFKIVDKTRTQPETKAWIEHLLELLPSDEWRVALSHTPEGAKNNLLTRHLNNYTRKNEADFFIHKQLGKFLRGELDFYIKNEVMHLDDIDEKSTDYLTTRVRLIKALRTIAQHIIRFLAQLENFQKKLWLKKKYITETQYCFTLDRVVSLGEQGQAPGQALLDTLLSHVDDKIRRYDGEMRSQHDEWIKLYAIDELDDYPEDGKLTVGFLRAHDKLILDTVFYPLDFKWQLLGAMEDLEEQLDGLLIHSENFQALNLVQEEKRSKIDSIYIDPPYNTGDDGFLYKDAYRHAGWMTMMLQSLEANKSLQSESCLLFSSIDRDEHRNLLPLFFAIYGEESFVDEIVWQKAYGGGSKTHLINNLHENIICFSAHKNKLPKLWLPPDPETLKYYKYSDEKVEVRGKYRTQPLNTNSNDYRFNLTYPLPIPKGVLPDDPKWKGNYNKIRDCLRTEAISLREIDGGFKLVTVSDCDVDFEELPPPRQWQWSWERTRKAIINDELVYRFNDEWVVDYKQYRFLEDGSERGKKPASVLVGPYTQSGTSEIRSAFGADVTKFPKPLGLISQLIGINYSNRRATILDYFAGSGTTAHAVINLNREDGGSRNYILVEMGDHFDTVLKPRIQKVVYSADWKDGKPTAPDTGVSHGFKYLRLESYEDALNNLDLGEDRAPDLLGLGDQVREDFLFSYLLDVETRGHLLNLDRFRDPWGCQLKVHDPHTGKSKARVIDLVETFHYLLGVTVREIRLQGNKDKPDAFLTIEGESPAGELILIIWRRLEANPDVDAAHKIDWPVTDNEDLKAFASTNRGTARGLNPADTEFHAIYINGDHTLADPNSKIHCIEEVFYERMFADTGDPED